MSNTGVSSTGTSGANSRTAAAIDATGGRALIGYLPIGFPDLQTSVDAAIATVEAGATALELGIPYSDPALDGAAIQKATQVSLDRGFRLAHVFEAIEAISSAVDAPLLSMTYWNPVLRYGVDRFARDFARAGGAGLITPDLTPDNADEWIRASDAYDLDRVFLTAPSSSDARVKKVVDASRGFVYIVSTMGTTGVRADVDQAARRLVERARDAGVQHACVGIGISKPEHVHDVLSYADGAIVGSALVVALTEGGVEGLRGTVSALAAGAATVDAARNQEV